MRTLMDIVLKDVGEQTKIAETIDWIEIWSGCWVDQIRIVDGLWKSDCRNVVNESLAWPST